MDYVFAMRWVSLPLLAMLGLACASQPTVGAREARPAGSSPYPLAGDAELPPVPAGPVEGDGADDGDVPAAGPDLRRLAAASRAEFRRVESPPAASAHPLVCDVTPFRGRLFVAHSVRPVSRAGATVHRYDPAGPAGGRWDVALDWGGNPATRYGRAGGGEGFTRVRAVGGRLLVPDTDTPGPGFGLSGASFEEYVFASDERGEFARPGPGGGPPAGTRVVPRSFHNFDVIRYRGSLIVSGGTGVIAPDQWGPFPAGLAVGDLSATEWPVRFQPGAGTKTGVLRATFMHRFKGRLYIGFQNNERRARWDAAILTGDPAAAGTPAPVLVRFTERGGWLTHRWASGDGSLYWIGAQYRRHGRKSVLYHSQDGESFGRVALPAGAGRPQDLAVVDGVRYLLTDRGLFRSRLAAGPWEKLADAPDGDPFGAYDSFCSAPLVAAGDSLYAGGTRDGQLYRVFVADKSLAKY